MRVWPAIDLMDGDVVQLVGGRPGSERVRLPDALGVAARWHRAGLSRLHVVDLDAATGSGDNRGTVEALVAAAGERGTIVQLGGGIRDDRSADRALAGGADRIIVGTRAVREPEWLEALAGRHPRRVVLAADVRGEEVVVSGWSEGSGVSLGELLARVDSLPLAGLLVTDVGREGKLGGVDRDRYTRVIRSSGHAVLAAGGIRSLDDLRILADCGAGGAVVGMALYTGAVDAAAAAREFER